MPTSPGARVAGRGVSQHRKWGRTVVQAVEQQASKWSTWFSEEVLESLEQDLNEVPEVARVLMELTKLDGSWGWSRYSIGELGQPYRMIELAARLIGDQRGLSRIASMKVVVSSLASFDTRSRENAHDSPFVRCVIDMCGTFDESEVARLRSSGFSDQEIAEIAGAVALTLFTGLLTHTPELEDEFTRVEAMAFAG